MLQPQGNRMLVKPLPQDEEALGSLIIPGTVSADLERAEIISVSKDVSLLSSEGEPLYKVGDIILYASGSGVGQRIGKDFFKWIQSTEVWAIDVPEL